MTSDYKMDLRWIPWNILYQNYVSPLFDTVNPPIHGRRGGCLVYFDTSSQPALSLPFYGPSDALPRARFPPAPRTPDFIS